jgi:thioredoxin 1
MNYRAQFFSAAACVVLTLAGCGNPAAMNQSTANVKHIAQGEFENEVTRSTNAIVADFYATWCGPCRTLSPMLDRLAEPLAGKIKFVKINVDESPGIAQNFSVQGIPTLIFFKDGKVADRITGLPPEAELKAKLEAFAAGK